jgi:predicted PurR-regulated permease PerM
MQKNLPESPQWNSTTKAIIGMTVVAIFAGLLVQFRHIIGPLILAFMLSYLLHPVAKRLSTNEKISWRMAVNLIFLLLFILVIALFTATGVAVVQQLQSLIGFVQRNVTNLPALVAELSNKSYHFGPFDLSLAQFYLKALLDQLLSWVQPILGRAGGIISALAASAAVTVGWGLFVLIISYFLLADADRVTDELVHIDIPGYNQDLRRLGQELRKIWNAFLRGQLTIILLIIISYSILMGVIGIRFAIGIAILAGLGRFVPYLGPLVLWVVTALVAYFQGGNYFGLQPMAYAILVLGLAFTIDQVFDNLVAPRVMGQTLGVHPAAVLVTAIIAARLIGLIGLLLAAPVVATFKLLSTYIIRKMFDLEPWPTLESPNPSSEMPWSKLMSLMRRWWVVIKRRLVKG